MLKIKKENVMSFKKHNEKEKLEKDQNNCCENEHSCKCEENHEECHCKHDKHHSGHNDHCECGHHHSKENGCECGHGEECDCHHGYECQCDESCECDCECDCGCEEGCDCGCEEEQAQAIYYLSMAQRIQAEFDNYRKRTQTAEKEAKQNGIAFAVETLLPIVDSIENAKLQVKDDNLKKAIELINEQLMQSFKKLGVEKIEAFGKEFDPNLHNAIMMGNEENQKENIVLQEFQAGFTLNGKVIRHSVVKVNK